MKTLAIVIIICLAVLSTPLSLKKLIDRQKYTSSSLKDMLQEAGHAGSAEDQEEELFNEKNQRDTEL